MSTISGPSGPRGSVGGGQEEPTHVLRRESAVYRDEVSRSVSRLLMFLSIPWLIHVWTIVADVEALLNDTSKPTDALVQVSQSATASQGILILIAFCFDANVERIYKEMKDDLCEWYINGTQEMAALRAMGKEQFSRSDRFTRWVVKRFILSQDDLSNAAGGDQVFNPDVQSYSRSRDRAPVVLPSPSWQQPKPKQGRNVGNVISLSKPPSDAVRPSQFFLGLTPPPEGRDPRKFSIITLEDYHTPPSTGDAPGKTMEQKSESSSARQSSSKKTDWSTLALL